MLFPPVMNDITTSFTDPPAFLAIGKLEPKRDYSYPERFVSLQKEHYPQIKPLIAEGSPETIFGTVVELVKSRGWDMVAVDEAKKRIEAIAVTALLRFKDDVVIEIRPGKSPGTVEIHMRSRSRIGRNDFAANANRIRDFFKLLSMSLGQ